ncbi:uncharacterized protein LOC110028037 [Phalaenopsis equestris]|uniref:uncharacterized protein LOC110028037 n=1 Tax=Phalaenopsis equestris TaxID=78828 RepID=UPI0009E520F6|nr:uncharacterized protein LOC110028037 [Phalaenopsis equestris]
MAYPSLLVAVFAVLLLAAGAAARPGVHFHPCKTLFISYTFTSSESFDLPQIPDHRNPSSSPSSGGYFAVYRIFRPLRPITSSSAFALPSSTLRPMIVDRPRRPAEVVQAEASFGMSSLQERAKDILVVVAGLLFGVGCGALTGAIMYLAWSLFANHYDICSYGDGEEDEEDESPKKMGYIKIAESVPAKEGYEGH